jgi:hypothetical protein
MIVDEFSSGRAIWDLVEELGEDRTFHVREFQAVFIGTGGKWGNIQGSLRRDSPNDYPYLDLDGDLMKSFGIPRSIFRHQQVTFQYDKTSKQLSVSGEGFPAFMLRFSVNA